MKVGKSHSKVYKGDVHSAFQVHSKQNIQHATAYNTQDVILKMIKMRILGTLSNFKIRRDVTHGRLRISDTTCAFNGNSPGICNLPRVT